MRKKGNFFWVLPSLLFFVLFLAVVLGYSIYLATQNINLVKPNSWYVGLDNFKELWHDSRAWSSLRKTFQFSIAATAIEMLLGLGLALYLNRNFPGRNLVRAIILIPMIMTPVVAGLIWRVFYDPNNGIINYYLGVLGLPTPDWLGSTKTAMLSVIIADVWQWTPFVFLVIAASLDAMPSDPIEAASVDGANKFQIFWHITLPMLKPVLVIAFLFRFIDSIKQFDLIYVMTRGGPSMATETMNMYAYTQGFNNFNISYAAAINLAISVLLIVGVGIFFVLVSRRQTGR
ncbi:MAG: hypothetical protein BAA01_12920 [Bacillus thermozeamaize]|uniref:ABC transmembrane type-1 domain-containing protein n=1 Tax=Bacillus thermozeamaize TaxID=230954 RepID=A0A1Y3PK28_9BACI|nr:MAG: hypothetical protein BAA01_12920 [Bacillus thermozeamaize]